MAAKQYQDIGAVVQEAGTTRQYQAIASVVQEEAAAAGVRRSSIYTGSALTQHGLQTGGRL